MVTVAEVVNVRRACIESVDVVRGVIMILDSALIIGKVPMFYYLLHVPLIHLVAVVVCYARYREVHWMFESPTINEFPITQPPGWGFSLPIVYLVWFSS